MLNDTAIEDLSVFLTKSMSDDPHTEDAVMLYDSLSELIRDWNNTYGEHSPESWG